MKKKTVAALLLAGITLAALGSPQTAQGAVQTDDSTVIEEGVSAQGIDLSGRTAAEARELLEENLQAIADSTLTVTFDEQIAEITPGELVFPGTWTRRWRRQPPWGRAVSSSPVIRRRQT